MRRTVGYLRAKVLSQTICSLVKVSYGALHNRSSNNTINCYCNVTAAAENYLSIFYVTVFLLCASHNLQHSLSVFAQLTNFAI